MWREGETSNLNMQGTLLLKLKLGCQQVVSQQVQQFLSGSECKHSRCVVCYCHSAIMLFVFNCSRTMFKAVIVNMSFLHKLFA